MSTSGWCKSFLFSVPFDLQLWDINNLKKEPLYSIPGHLRDPSICVPESGWIWQWRRWQSKGIRGGASVRQRWWCQRRSQLARQRASRTFLSEKEGEGSEWGYPLCPYLLELETNCTQNRDCNDLGEGREREISKEGKVLPAVCLGGKRTAHRSLGPSFTLGSPTWSLAHPKPQVLSMYLPAALLPPFAFFFLMHVFLTSVVNQPL